MTKKSYDYLFKLLLIGDSGVGKTSLILRYTEDSFSATFISTIGIDFKIKTFDIGGKKIKLQIWDTAGQERFQTITTSYYRGAMGIMLLYDITNRKSFENISKWLGCIQQHANDAVEKILIGNKCDDEQRRVITTEAGRAVASENAIPFFETSARTGENANKAFEELALAILRRIPKNETDKVVSHSGHKLATTEPGRLSKDLHSKCCS